MDYNLITYRTFSDITLANQLADILDEHQIQYSLESSAPGFDPRNMGSASTEYLIKIDASDFERVNDILEESGIENAEIADDDYYLFAFTDEELIDLISKPDEWNPFDVTLARKILSERGTIISDEQMKTLRQQRLEELKRTEPPQSSWIVAGYIFAILGGVLGLFIGWHLSSHKKTLPNGEQIFAYNESDRKQGKFIFYLALAMSVIWITVRTLKSS